MNTIGKRLKQLRLSVKKTLDEESKIFDVSLNSVYRWEHDLCVPRKSVLKKIAYFYDVPFEWLLNGSGNVSKNRPLHIVLDKENGETRYKFQLEIIDVRFWQSGMNNLNESFNLPQSMPKGIYTVTFRLPDIMENLPIHPENNIIQDNKNGYNKLGDLIIY